MIEMKVTGLTIDPFTDMPIIILKDATGKYAVPIWIGIVEASAIASELENVRLQRPMTHDLMCDAIAKLGGKVRQVEVNDLRENTFFARVLVESGDRVLELDSRPSDAIALALRAGSPILVAPRVVERVHRMELAPDADAGELDEPNELDGLEGSEGTDEPAGSRAERGRTEGSSGRRGAEAAGGRGARERRANGEAPASPSGRRTNGRSREREPLRISTGGPILLDPSARPGAAAARSGRGRAPAPADRATDGANLPDEGEVYRALLESLSDEDFGKWKM